MQASSAMKPESHPTYFYLISVPFYLAIYFLSLAAFYGLDLVSLCFGFNFCSLILPSQRLPGLLDSSKGHMCMNSLHSYDKDKSIHFALSSVQLPAIKMQVACVVLVRSFREEFIQIHTQLHV